MLMQVDFRTRIDRTRTRGLDVAGWTDGDELRLQDALAVVIPMPSIVVIFEEVSCPEASVTLQADHPHGFTKAHLARSLVRHFAAVFASEPCLRFLHDMREECQNPHYTIHLASLCQMWKPKDVFMLAPD